MSHEIDKQSLSIFFASKCDFWGQGIQWIYIELYTYPQVIVSNDMNFSRYPHIGRGPTCRWQSSSVKPLRLHSMHFSRAFRSFTGAAANYWQVCEFPWRVSYWNWVCEFPLKFGISVRLREYSMDSPWYRSENALMDASGPFQCPHCQ